MQAHDTMTMITTSLFDDFRKSIRPMPLCTDTVAGCTMPFFYSYRFATPISASAMTPRLSVTAVKA